MAVPENFRKLGTIGTAYKGDYDPNKQYKYLNEVYYEGSTYIALKDNPDGTPKDDGLNWKFLAKGFIEQEISALTVVDTDGILGEKGATVNAQDFIDYLATHKLAIDDVLDSLEEVVANQEKRRAAGALAVKELNSNLDIVFNKKTAGISVENTGNSNLITGTIEESGIYIFSTAFSCYVPQNLANARMRIIVLLGSNASLGSEVTPNTSYKSVQDLWITKANKGDTFSVNLYTETNIPQNNSNTISLTILRIK